MVVGVDSVTNNWSQCKTPGIDCSAADTSLKNTDFRDWGTPIYAMADGTFVHCVYNVPANPQPWGCCLHCAKCMVNPDGSIAALPIKKGELLGHVGNSGNVCGQPHTHIHSMLYRSGIVDNKGFEQRPLKLRPLPFSGAFALDETAVDHVTFTGLGSSSTGWVRRQYGV
jgi:hypothetical protein